MATKDITDAQVVQAYHDAAKMRVKGNVWPSDLLMERTGQTIKVVYSAMERAHRHQLIDFGVSLRAGWLTPAGEALLEKGGKE
jgi:hypothetical protein